MAKMGDCMLEEARHRQAIEADNQRIDFRHGARIGLFGQIDSGREGRRISRSGGRAIGTGIGLRSGLRIQRRFGAPKRAPCALGSDITR